VTIGDRSIQFKLPPMINTPDVPSGPGPPRDAGRPGSKTPGIPPLAGLGVDYISRSQLSRQLARLSHRISSRAAEDCVRSGACRRRPGDGLLKHIEVVDQDKCLR